VFFNQLTSAGVTAHFPQFGKIPAAKTDGVTSLSVMEWGHNVPAIELSGDGLDTAARKMGHVS
jgi:hypothetical protein